MENKFNKGIEDLKQVKLSQTEKKVIFERLNNYASKNDLVMKRVSPWYNFADFLKIPKSGYALALVVVLLFSGTGVISAAKKSLPGDKLYSLKVDVIEPLKYTLAVGPVAKANVEVENGFSRLEEAEALEAEGRLSTSSEDDLAQRFEKHANLFDQLVNENEIGTSTTMAMKAPVEYEEKINEKVLVGDKAKANVSPKAQVKSLDVSSEESDSADDSDAEIKDQNIGARTMQMATNTDQTKKISKHAKAFLDILDSRRAAKKDKTSQE